MTHRQYIESNFEVLAKTTKSIYFIAYGEECCEINNTEFDCHSVEEFYELVEMFENEDLSIWKVFFLLCDLVKNFNLFIMIEQ